MEVCSVVDVSQFEPGKTVDACGFYSVSLLFHAGKTGQATPFNASDVALWADGEYTKYDGPDVASNGSGMDMATLLAVLHDAGLHYQVIGSDELSYHTERLTAAYLRAWLNLKFPLILAVAESSVYDLDLQGSPYAWDTSGLYHIIVATGIDGTAILCHDTASIAPDGVRPGPRRYDAAKLEAGLTSATAVVMSWLQRPQGDFDPIASGGIMAPSGWRDDGKTLTAPNGIPVKAGFRDHVLNYPGGWDATNWPMAAEQSLSETELAIHSGAGSRQIFRTVMLVWYADRGVVAAWTGAELFAWIQQSLAQATKIAAYEGLIKTCDAQIITLQAQLKAAQTPVGPSTIDVPGAIAAAGRIAGSLGVIEKDAVVLKAALGIQ